MGITLRLAWRNLWRHSRRTWLTASAIAFVTTLLVFIITIQLGSYDMIIDSSLRVFTGQLQVQKKGYLDKPSIRSAIPAAREKAQHLRTAIGIEDISVRATGFALASSGSRSYGVPVVGVEPDYEARVSTIPRLIKEGHYFSGIDAQEALVGVKLAHNLKIKTGDELILLGTAMDGSVAATVLPVVGIFESGVPDLDRHMVQLPLATFQEVFSMGEAAHTIVIAAPDLSQLPRLKTEVAHLLPPDQSLVVLDWDQLIPGLKQLIQADWTTAWFIYIALILVVTFSILNTFLMSVLERTREFGIMLALGASPLRIGALVVLESMLLTLLGLAIGIILGGAITLYFYFEGFTFQTLQEVYAEYGLPGVITPKLTFESIGTGPIVILFFVLLASLYPALRIRRLSAVEAMRAV
ncbi:MAG: FtsX-like permease family protein [Gammaproteobacteria bacterium]|nr:MAG: FtsX-like permease family protein [Gammaproteobacteria bacterium]